MRIIFIGTVEFSKTALNKLINLGADIVGVSTLKKSKFNSDYVDLSPICKNNNILIYKAENVNSKDNIMWIKKRKPDIIFCLGLSQLIKKELLELTPLGVVGYHPTLLPSNRGRHPIIWSLALGLKETGSTYFFMDEGADTGDIISQEKVEISSQDNARSLYNKISNIAIEQLNEIFLMVLSQDFIKIKQNNNKANYWRKRKPIDGQIDWRMSANSIYNLVRSLSEPYVGAHFKFNDQDIKIWNSKVIINNCNNMEPGKVIGYKENSPIVKCGQDSIVLLDIVPKINIKIGEYL